MSITTNFESDFLHILGRIKSFLNERYKIGLVTWLCVDCVEKEGIKTWGGGEGIGVLLFLALFKKKKNTNAYRGFLISRKQLWKTKNINH